MPDEPMDDEEMEAMEAARALLKNILNDELEIIEDLPTTTKIIAKALLEFRGDRN